jgi:hypothetical protein
VLSAITTTNAFQSANLVIRVSSRLGRWGWWGLSMFSDINWTWISNKLDDVLLESRKTIIYQIYIAAISPLIQVRISRNHFLDYLISYTIILLLDHLRIALKSISMATVAPLKTVTANNHFQSGLIKSTYVTDKFNEIYSPRGDTTVTLNYFRPPEDGSVPYNFVEKQPEGVAQRNFGDFDVIVPIHDIRGRESEYTLDKDAFMVVSNVSDSAERDFCDDESIKKNYYPEVEKLILDNVPGSNKVFIFDHTIRRSSPNAHRAPVTRVHIDQTVKSATARVHHHLPEEAEKLLQGRYRIINIWRPLNGPVQANPLGFASSSTLKDEDLIPIEHRYPDITGETAGIRYNKTQEWHYLSGMNNNERLFLECFDSESRKLGSGVQGGRVPHTAFKDPRTPQNAIGRESIEVRALVFGP